MTFCLVACDTMAELALEAWPESEGEDELSEEGVREASLLEAAAQRLKLGEQRLRDADQQLAAAKRERTAAATEVESARAALAKLGAPLPPPLSAPSAVEAPDGAAPSAATLRLFVNFQTSVPDVTEPSLLALFARFGEPRCCHVRRSKSGREGSFASIHLATTRARALEAVSSLSGRLFGGTVSLAPADKQTPCGMPGCGNAPPETELPRKRARRAALAARQLALREEGGRRVRLFGSLSGDSGEAERLLSSLDAVTFVQPMDDGYAAALALGAEATDEAVRASAEPDVSPPSAELRCAPADAAEAQSLAQLPARFAARPDAVDEARPCNWRMLVQPATSPSADGSRLLRCRVCTVSAKGCWQTLLAERKLGLALDLDDTLIKAFSLSDMRAQHASLALEVAAAAQRSNGFLSVGAPDKAMQRELTARLDVCAVWLQRFEEYALRGECPSLKDFALQASPLSMGADRPAGPAYTCYRVPGGLLRGLACECLLLRTSGSPTLLCLRPGWAELRETLRSRFVCIAATHASSEYAAEACRVLDPALGEPHFLHLLRGGGEGEHSSWTVHAPRRVQLPVAASPLEKGARAAPKPLMQHLACFRRESAAAAAAVDDSASLIQKSFLALRAVLACSNAFIALDDLSGGRAAGKVIWAPSDLPRVLCPPPFRPFGPPETARVLNRTGDALVAVHAAFFAAVADGTLLSTSAVQLLASEVAKQEAILLTRLRPAGVT